MQRLRLLISVLILTGLVPGSVLARDVELRSRSDTDATGTSFPAVSNESSSNTGQRMSTEERLSRVEGIVDGQMLDILMRLQSIEREIQVLRGTIEVHTHQLDEGSKKQKELYLDLDRRLSAIEKQVQTLATAPPAPTPSQPPAAAPVAPATTPATPKGPAAVEKTPAEDEQQIYQQALDFLYQQQYDKAVTGFRGYIHKYPKGRYAHVCQYWVAEAFFAQGLYKPAIVEYQRLITGYPASPKIAEAMLKVGDSYIRLNEPAKARPVLEQIGRSYPGTDEARQAHSLLAKIKTKPATTTGKKK